MSAPIQTANVEHPKAALNPADVQEEASRASVTGGVQTPSKGLPEGTTKPGAPATAAGVGSEKKVESTEKKTEGGEEKKGESEAMVRSSYLPANKLKDAPPLEKYEGKDPMSFAKDSSVGTGAQIKEKLTEVKDKITHVGKSKDSK